MTPIRLYPCEGSHKTAAALGGVNIAGAAVLGAGFAVPVFVPLALAAIGAVMIAKTARRYANPQPCFEADDVGFTILGGEMRDWSEFRSAAVRHAQSGFSPAPSSIAIKTGTSVLGRDIQIKYTHLSAPVAEMVREINAYAAHAKRKQDLNVAMAGILPTGRIPVTHSGPVQSVPKLVHRLLGRRRVI